MSNPNGMVSLVNFLGDEKIKFQVVHQSATNVTTKSGGVARVTLETEAGNISPADLLTGKPTRYGLLLWVDSDDFNSWMQHRGDSRGGEGE